jgi:hypothetical protein
MRSTLLCTSLPIEAYNQPRTFNERTILYQCINYCSCVLAKAGSESKYPTAPSAELLKGRGGEVPHGCRQSAGKAAAAALCSATRRPTLGLISPFVHGYIRDLTLLKTSSLHLMGGYLDSIFHDRTDATNQIPAPFPGFDPHSTQTFHLPIPNSNHLRNLV